MVLSEVLTPILVPPVNLAALALVAVVLRRRVLAAALLAMLLALSMPAVGSRLLHSLDSGLPDTPDATGAQAVLILSADLDEERHGRRAVPGPLTLQRMQAGVALARATGLPIAVTGGAAVTGGPAVGTAMAESLAQDFRMPARWVEDRSFDTWENARDSAALLNPDGVRTVLLVTHAWHMRRSLLAFEGSGLVARPAPLWVDAVPGLLADEWVPRTSGWLASYIALHEWVGLGWYWARVWLGF